MKISIVIATTNRKSELEYSINQYFKQSYQDFEILVMDNASNDGTGEMIKEKYSDNEKIRYYRFEENLYFTAFNYGVWESKGDIIWVCDDDSNPRDTDCFEKVIEKFVKFPQIAILGTEDIEVNSNNSIWNWHPLEVDKHNIPEDGFKTCLFHGTGAGIRKEVFNKIGGFWGFGMEELDFTTRAIIAGYEARYFPNIVTMHHNSPKMRFKEERWIHMSSQVVKYNYKYFSFWKATGKVYPLLIIELFRAIALRFRPLIILNAILSWKYFAINTFRKEHTPIPKDKINDVTLGVSTWKNQMKYIKYVINNKVFRKKS